MKTRNVRLRKVIKGAIQIGGLGIGETLISGVMLPLMIVAGKVMFYLLGYLVAVIAGFLFTWLLGFNDPED